jgi:hypothetical protein
MVVNANTMEVTEEIFVQSSRETGVGVNADKTEYLSMTQKQPSAAGS